ncbi:MAG: LPXTG cell wall anchor domain-containing protein, partial [Clostridia bacterium]|nr:LPXTG cell wall anchor domain-containing protein [Clostridia bacterium]
RKFLENAKRSYESDVKYNPHIRYPSDTPERLAHFEELANRPPKTGEHTALYATIFVLAVLPLAGFGVYQWKKRRTV